MSAAEVIWLAHTETIQNLREDSPSKVRSYLVSASDFQALAEWDKSRIKESEN